MLTSPRNPTIRFIRKLQRSARDRRESGLFVAEGVRLIEEAASSGLAPETVLYTEGLGERGEALLDLFRTQGVQPTPVTEPVMAVASDARTPQGLLAVLPIPEGPLPGPVDFLLVLDEVRDPGNLGAVLRTAAAAGVDGVLIGPGSADPYQPKAVRAGMGAHFRLAVRAAEWPEIEAAVAGLTVFLADPSAESAYTDADLSVPLALVIGGEAHGPGPESARLDPSGLRIPMPGGTESLNAAVAAGVLVFEVVRQRNRESRIENRSSKIENPKGGVDGG
ncbi:MAG TPA: RNA methyltransferase [Anaerolineales bacterium]|nr:RNA methyltransferase [Anaerolineales bacterium]